MTRDEGAIMTFGAVPDPVIRSECGFAVNSFVGRRGELRELRQRLSDARLVTLTGPGGVGKSRLAHRAAVTLRRAYQDRVHCVDLLEAHDSRLLTQDLQDPDVLAHLVATTLGLPGDGAGTATEALIASFTPGPSLLLLDNCENLLPACAVLADTLLRACPELRLLTTSREPFQLDGETIVPLQPLPIPQANQASVAQLRLCDSMALFISRAAAVSDFVLTEDNAAATAELCRRLDGLPLAIELAAARMRTLGPAQMLQRTDDRFALLSRGSRTAPPRQQTLRACVDWSYDLCSKPEQRLWARLSVFADSFELDAVEGVCTDETLPAPELLDLVAVLVSKSVLISESSGGTWRYRMLATIRDYGRDRLVEVGEFDELSRRHRDYYAGLLRRTADDRFGPHQAGWVAQLSPELPNLSAALTYSLTAPEGAAAALEMSAVLWPLWAARGLHTEGRTRLEQALSRTSGPTPRRLEAWYGSAVLAAASGDVAAVRACAEHAQEVAAQLDDDRGYAIAACAAALLALTCGDLPAAARDWRTAVDGFPAEHSAGWRAVALAGLATTMSMIGDVDAAARCHEEIVALCPPDGESLLAGVSLSSLGLGLWMRGELEQATDRLRESLRRLRRVDDTFTIARCLRILAWIACDGRRAERAATLLGAAAGLGEAGVTPMPQLLPADQAEAERRIRAALGEPAFRTAFTRGSRMSVDDAVAYGLDERRPPVPGRRRSTSTPLTRRELQVAELVSQGHSNKEIAAMLVISQRTAESHVEKILTKLGLTRRSQVAVWMVRSIAAAEPLAA